MKELNPNKPVQLRDGRQVRNICWDFLTETGVRITGIVTNAGFDSFYTWDKSGHYYGNIHNSGSDLVNIPEKIQGWINVYQDTSPHKFIRNNIYATREEATEAADGEAIACYYIDILVGEGLE